MRRSQSSGAGTDAQAVVDEMPPRAYRLRFRAVDEAGNVSPWTEYGSDDPLVPDFVVR